VSQTVFVPARARLCRARVLSTIRLSSRYFLLRIVRPDEMPASAPGQFVHVAVPPGGRFFLRRPLSIHNCDDNALELLIVEAGEGTRRMRRLASGDSLDFYGPLGGAFPRSVTRVLAIGGGVGLAPLYYYGRRNAGGFRGTYRLLYGARTRDDLFLEHVPLEAQGVGLATDDGSYGFAGNVVSLAAAELDRDEADVLFSCGPTVMMRAVQRLADERGLAHYASLENRMACALGACRACVVPVRGARGREFRTVCHDGPVFDGSVLDWDGLPVP